MSEALIRRNDAAMLVEFTEAATALKDDALATAALVGKVTNAGEQADAVNAQTAIQNILSQAEKARKMCKEPVLDYGRKIDDAAKRFKSELDAEMLRISRLVGDFQQLEQQRMRAAEAARKADLDKLEREKQEALSKATSHDAADAIQEHYNNKAAESAAPMVQPVRVEGQVVRSDWEIEVTDIWTLSRAHPTCVKIEPRLSEIKELLKAGVKVLGVRATPITKSSVRAGRPAALIEV